MRMNRKFMIDSNVRAKLYLYAHKACKALGVTYYFDNGYGIKGLNKKQFTYKVTSNEKWIDAEQLILGYDGLKDPFTLVGCSIVDSPHFAFMKALKEKKDISQTDYVNREKEGSLDGRFEQFVTQAELEKHKAIFDRQLRNIASQNGLPSVVYRTQLGYVIIDGKHRAALGAYINGKARCVIVDSSEILRDTYLRDLYRCMKKNEAEYTRNIAFIEMLLEENNEEDFNY